MVPGQWLSESAGQLITLIAVKPISPASLRELIPDPAVWERMEGVEQRLIDVSTSNNAFLTKIAQHLLQAGGKRFRPLLALLAANLGPEPRERPIEAGVAVELIHLGSLYHDDVIDEAGARRGVVSANANWDNTVSILAGDFLLAKASEVAAEHLGEEAVILLARTYAQLCEGQVLELQITHDLDHGRDEYFQVIGDKTASLIRTSARLGAMASGSSRGDIETISSWAWDLGVAFQLIDDVLDLVAPSEFIGKPAGSDIREGTFTLAVLEALGGPEGDEIRDLLSGDDYPDRAVSRVIELVREGGYVDRATRASRHHVAMANEVLDRLTPGPTVETMRSLGDYLLNQIDRAQAAARVI